MRLRGILLGVVALVPIACIPADETPDLGSIAFHFASSTHTDEAVRWERVILGFKTMTIGDRTMPDRCAYRGRGAVSNVVFAPQVGITQTFNGIGPVDCPDVGIIFGPPDGATTIGPGASSADLIDLATPPVAQAIVEATLTTGGRAVRLALRFGADASSRFGGCIATESASATALRQGVTVRGDQRDQEDVRFAPETIFRTGLAPGASSSLQPFFAADAANDDDGIVTMADLDKYPLSSAAFDALVGGAVGDYELLDGTRAGSFGVYVRTLFRFSMLFGAGLCIGVDPAAPP